MKPISYYFPNIPTALTMLSEGRKKYENDKRFVVDNSKPRGKFVDAQGKVTIFIDNALAAIMYATGKEPELHDLNTPGCYGWDFDSTIDILNALDALSNNCVHYWNLYYGTEREVKIIPEKRLREFAEMFSVVDNDSQIED